MEKKNKYKKCLFRFLLGSIVNEGYDFIPKVLCALNVLHTDDTNINI